MKRLIEISLQRKFAYDFVELYVPAKPFEFSRNLRIVERLLKFVYNFISRLLRHTYSKPRLRSSIPFIHSSFSDSLIGSLVTGYKISYR